MLRRSNRAFRYFFPAVLGLSCLYLLRDGARNEAKESALEEISETKISVQGDAGFTKIQAKMLKLSSHNPETRASLLVNAFEAVQDTDKITLKNPHGLFEKPEGGAYLKSTQANYYENDSEVHFLDNVNFDHHSGLVATTDHAILNTKSQDIKGSNGIRACHNQNTITSVSYEIQTQKNILKFNDRVCLTVSQKQS